MIVGGFAPKKEGIRGTIPSMKRAAQLPFWPSLEAERATRTRRPARASRRSKRTAARETPAEKAVRERLQRRMGAWVGLVHKQGRGSFTVAFTSYDELDEILRRIDA